MFSRKYPGQGSNLWPSVSVIPCFRTGPDHVITRRRAGSTAVYQTGVGRSRGGYRPGDLTPWSLHLPACLRRTGHNAAVPSRLPRPFGPGRPAWLGVAFPAFWAGEGFAEFTRFAPARYRTGSLFRRKPTLNPAELPGDSITAVNQGLDIHLQQ